MRRREACCTTLQRGHPLFLSKANNGQAGSSRLSHKQEVERRTISEGKQHQPHCSQTCSVHNKALQTKDRASIIQHHTQKKT